VQQVVKDGEEFGGIKNGVHAFFFLFVLSWFFFFFFFSFSFLLLLHLVTFRFCALDRFNFSLQSIFSSFRQWHSRDHLQRDFARRQVYSLYRHRQEPDLGRQTAAHSGGGKH
jgi:hypothetical protein